jgi:hypothetical protein
MPFDPISYMLARKGVRRPIRTEDIADGAVTPPKMSFGFIVYDTPSITTTFKIPSNIIVGRFGKLVVDSGGEVWVEGALAIY